MIKGVNGSVFKYNLFRNVKDSDDSKLNLFFKIPNCFSDDQIKQFYSLSCFDERLFHKHYPNDPEYREFIITSLLSTISIAAEIAPLPIHGSKVNHTRDITHELDASIKHLGVAIKAINKLPNAFIDTPDMNKLVHREDISTYRDQLILWNDKLKSFDRNELLLNRIFISFASGFGIPEYDDILNSKLVLDIVQIFTGIDDIESVRRIVTRYKDKKAKK
jgi:hypothetical protein